MIIKNGYIVTMEGEPIENGYIVIENEKIKEIGQGECRCDSDEIIDAKGCWVLPGFIDAHSHVGLSEQKKGKEGNDCNELTNPITPYVRGLDGINPLDLGFANAIKAGVTSAMVGPGSSNVVGGQFVFIKTFGDCIDDMVVLEPAAMKIAFGENPKTNYGGMNVMPSTRMSIAAMLREELTRAKNYIENGDPENFELECWRPVFEKKIPLKAHVHRADDILTAIRIANEFGLDITLDHCSEGRFIVDKIAKSGFPAIVGPNLASKDKIEIQYMDFKTIGILNEAGVKVAITMDHPVTLLEYLPISAALAVKAGMDYMEALKAITIYPAEICRVADRVGSLKEGKDADIVIYSGNPIDIESECKYTIINGKIMR